MLCVFGSRTFVPTGSIRKTQTSISHSSTEYRVVTLDAGLRIDGILLFFTSGNVVMLEKYCATLLGVFQDSDFAGDLEDSKSISGHSMYLRESDVCSNQLCRSKLQFHTVLRNPRSFL